MRKRMKVIVHSFALIASALLIAISTYSQSSTPQPTGAVEFYLTGDEYSGVVTIKEITASSKFELGVIGGMRSHSLRVDAQPGNHFYMVTMGDDKNDRDAQVVVKSGMLHKVRIDLHAVRSETSGLRTVTTYYDAQVTNEPAQILPPEQKFSDLPQWQQGSLVLLAVIGLPLIWFTPIWLGVRTARKKRLSPHWMWFGIHPLFGWIACLVLLLAKPRR